MSYVQVYIRSLGILWKRERTRTIALAVACLGVGWIQAFEPVLFGRVIDTIAKSGDDFRVLGFWGGLGLLNVGASVFIAVASDRVAHRRRLAILGDVFERAIALPAAYHAERGSGRVVRGILAGTDQLFNLWLSFLREQLASIIGVAFLVPIALAMDWRMTALLFALAAIYMVANYWIHARTHAKQEEVERYNQEMFGRVGDVVGNVTVVQSYVRLMDEAQSLRRLMAQLLTAQYPILTWWGVLSIITRVSSTLTMVSMLAMGCWLARSGELTPGQVVAFATFSTLLIAKLEQISGFLSRTVSQAPSLAAFFDLLGQQTEAMERPDARPVPADLKGEVVFEDVSFHFPGSQAGVSKLAFTAKPGETVALVGPSGSGKTTTLALLQRLFDPQEGAVRVDGVDVREYTLASLRGSIATVFQDSGLFNRSIGENIRIGRPDATDAEVEEASRKADAHDFIMRKPGGYDFVIGERGAALSGGERQRIAIARAILKNAPILIFDEATSALDNQTEKKIQRAIARLRDERRTTFVIAHRLSTARAADRILVFEKGEIVEAGDFKSLRKLNGLFARLVEAGELAEDAASDSTTAAPVRLDEDLAANESPREQSLFPGGPL